jgi:hypothetical protein
MFFAVIMTSGLFCMVMKNNTKFAAVADVVADAAADAVADTVTAAVTAAAAAIASDVVIAVALACTDEAVSAVVMWL